MEQIEDIEARIARFDIQLLIELKSNSVLFNLDQLSVEIIGLSI